MMLETKKLEYNAIPISSYYDTPPRRFRNIVLVTRELSSPTGMGTKPEGTHPAQTPCWLSGTLAKIFVTKVRPFLTRLFKYLYKKYDASEYMIHIVTIFRRTQGIPYEFF